MANAAIVTLVLLTAVAFAPLAAAAPAPPPLVGSGGQCTALVHVNCGPEYNTPTGHCAIAIAGDCWFY